MILRNPQPLVLSKNQEQILLMLSSGYKSSEIIDILGISSSSYQDTTKRIRKKVGASTTSQALSFLISNNYFLKVDALNFSSALSKILAWKNRECSALQECVDEGVDNFFLDFNKNSALGFDSVSKNKGDV